MSWHPILEGSLRDRALAAIEDIAREVPCTAQPDEEKVSLNNGVAGRALFHAYRARCTGSPRDQVVAMRLLRQTLDAWPVGSAVARSLLYESLLGVAWVAVHLDEAFGDDDSGGPDWGEMDEMLPWIVDQHARMGSYELLAGQVGVGLYALERLPERRARECIVRIVESLSRSARRLEGGVAWTRIAAEGSWQRRVCQGEYVDVGVAHGVAGVLPFLAEAAACGGASEGARALLEPAVAWLLDQRIRGVTGASFPDLVAPGRAPVPRRLAWCYGDVGIAAALLHTATCAGREDWEREAIGIARGVMRLGPEHAQAADASVCHGTAGLGHVFNRMYQTTGEEGLREAAVAWLERALDFRRPGVGVGGYLAFGDVEGRSEYLAESGFLTGAAGVGLCLLAATSEVEPRWDRALMISGPTGSAPGRTPA